MGKCNKLKRVYYNEYFSLCTTVMAYNTDLLTLINPSVLKLIRVAWSARWLADQVVLCVCISRLYSFNKVILIIMWSSLLYNSLEHTTRSVNIACLYAPLLAEVVFAAMFKLSYGELFHRASHWDLSCNNPIYSLQIYTALLKRRILQL